MTLRIASPACRLVRWPTLLPFLVLASLSSLHGLCLSDDLTIASSTFDTDADGWTFVGNGTGLSWQSTGGNPGGHISIQDPGPGDQLFWAAPPKFLGDRSAALGGYLLFDLSASVPSSPVFREQIRLRGGGLVLSAFVDNIVPAVFPQWSSFRCIRLDTSTPWLLPSANRASEAQIASVLGSLLAIEIRADFDPGAETTRLDNVLLVAGHPITILHSFDSSLQGWTAVGDPAAVTWVSSGGNPGGHVIATDARQGQYIYWASPASFVDAMRYGYGGRLTFDLSQSNPPDADIGPEDIILYGTTHGVTRSLRLSVSPEPEQYTSWSRYVVHLNECEPWRLNGGPIATAAEIRLVLDGLEIMFIKAEFHNNGAETDRLDNVGFAPPCSQAIRAGLDDAFQAPSEAASPSVHLSAALTMPGLSFDLIPGAGTTSPNRQLAHTFTGLPASLDAAILLLDLRAGSDGAPGGEADDRIRLGFADAGGFSEYWSAHIGGGNPTPGLLQGAWASGRDVVLGLDLSRLPLAGGGALDLVAELEARGFLDVIVEDDTGADYLRLSHAPCTPHVLQVEPTPCSCAGVRLTVGPNPATTSARFELAIPRPTNARLTIYDLMGRRVVTLFDGPGMGPMDVTWSLLDARGVRVATGVYLAVVEVGRERLVKRVAVVR